MITIQGREFTATISDRGSLKVRDRYGTLVCALSCIELDDAKLILDAAIRQRDLHNGQVEYTLPDNAS